MCGIVGIVSSKEIQEKIWLSDAVNSIVHRGPDDFGIEWTNSNKIGFGHRRLSILDLSKAGHQPMSNVSNELLIVFNGEVYNYLELRDELKSKGHSFNTNTDTEVVMAAYRQWGIDCVSKFNGMFAFALYDKNNQKVFFARDRAGEKPLFYSFINDSIRFGSELKSLFADPKFPRKINRRALDSLLANGYIAGGDCIINGVNKLPPAHAMMFDLNTSDLKIWKYWELPEFDSSINMNEVELLDELENLLNDSVKKQLVADVPVGVLLSGGVDSSIVTALASRNVSNLKTFTVSFPGHNKFDESSHAKLIANHFSTEHTVLPASDVSVNELLQLAKQFDEPIFDSSMIPTYLVSQLIRKHCKVALGGDGGDELFGGYGHHSRLLWMAENLGKLPVSMRKMAAFTAKSILPIGFKGRIWLQSLGEDFANGLPLIASQFEPITRKKLMSNYSDWELIAENIRKSRIPKESNLLQRATRMDFLNYLPEDILVKVDRSSMLNSLEVRAPLLDYRIIEFAFKKVPHYLKANTIDKKIILKKLTNRLLPDDFDKSRKQGFGIPIGTWIRSNNEWKDFFKEHLIDSDDSIFDKNELSKLLNSHIEGRENTERLFGLLMFELWRKEYKITL